VELIVQPDRKDVVGEMGVDQEHAQSQTFLSRDYAVRRPGNAHESFSGNSMSVRTRPAVTDEITQGTANMEDHEARRKIIREWMALPK
jgi:hypothetical protein